MREHLSAIFLLILLLLGMAGWAQAETWKGRNLKLDIEKAPWHLGPFRIQPVLYLTDAGYDSNIYGLTDRVVDDYWFQAGPGVRAYVAIKKKIVFSVSESPRYVYFFKTARERAWNNYLTGEVSLLLTRAFLTGGVVYNNYKYRYPFEIDIWPRAREEGAFGSFLYQVSKKTSFSVGVRRTRYSFDNLDYEVYDIKGRLSRREDYLTVSGFYQVTPRIMFSASGEYGLIDFDNPVSFGDAESRAVYGGLDFSPTGNVRGSVKLGYKELRPRVAGRAGFKGVVGSANISFPVFRALTARAQYGRDVQFSMWFDNTFFIDDRYGAGLSLYVLRRRVRLDYDYSVNYDRYPIAAVDQKVDRESSTFGIVFRLKQNIGIGIRGGTYRWRYNYYSGDSKRTFVGLNLTYDF